MNDEEYLKHLKENQQKSENREIVELLLDPDKVELATELKDREIPLITILKIEGSNPLGSGDGLKLTLPLIEELTKQFKVDRVSLERKSRKEVIEGMLSSKADEKALSDKIMGMFGRQM